MDPLQASFTLAGLLLIPALIVGLVVRPLHRPCAVFVAYLSVVWISEALILASPARFYTWGFFMAKEVLLGALKLAVLVEVLTRTFEAFPGARRTARALVLVGLVALLAVVLVNAGAQARASLAARAQSAVSILANGTALLYALLWGAALWYHLPFYRMHWAILRGLVPYLLVLTFGARLLLTFGFDSRPLASTLVGGAYVVVLAYWTWEAWRRREEEPVSPDTLRRIQPWRARL